MKKFAALLILLFSFCLANVAFAFREAPVAVIILDNTHSVDGELTEIWRERVARRFRFPDYRLLSQGELRNALYNNLPTADSKSPFYKKRQLREIADITQAEVVFVIWVNNLDEQTIYSFFPFGDTYQRVKVSLDITSYRKSDDIYFEKKVRYSKTNDLAISTSAKQVATAELSEAINKFKEQLPRLENQELIEETR